MHAVLEQGKYRLEMISYLFVACFGAQGSNQLLAEFSLHGTLKNVMW